MKEDLLISIITPAYNSESYIADLVKSIVTQSYPFWELLITDDNSDDQTLVIAKNFESIDSRIHVFKQDQNGGAARARNNSISQAKGRFIAFLDADDRWFPDKLEKQLHFMLENNLDLSYTGYYKIDESGKLIGKVVGKSKLDYCDLLKNNYIGCLTAMYDTKRLGKVFMPDIRKRQDWALWLKISRRTSKIAGIPEPLAEYRVRKNSISSNKLEMIKYNWLVYRRIEGFSRLKSLFLIFQFFAFLAKKKFLDFNFDRS